MEEKVASVQVAPKVRLAPQSDPNLYWEPPPGSETR